MEPVEPSMESAFMKLAACVALPPWAKSSRCHSEESAHALVGAGDEVRCRDSGGVHRTPETGESAFARRPQNDMLFARLESPGQQESKIVPDHRRGQNQRIDAIEHATRSQQQRTPILDPGAPLVAGLPQGAGRTVGDRKTSHADGR